MSQIELWWLMEKGQYSYLESKSYRQLQILAKSNKIKAHGTKYQLITRINQNFSDDGDNNTPISTTQTAIKSFVQPKPRIIKYPTKKYPTSAIGLGFKTPETLFLGESPYDSSLTFVQKTITTTSTDKLVGPFYPSKDPIRKWIKDDSITYYLGELVNRSKIASFDMDSTLVVNPSGKTHAISKDDWVWWNECVADNLRNLYKNGYQVVIFTNQGGIGHGGKFNQTKWDQITQKINILEKELGFPLISFIACADDANRKPNRKMWDMMYTCTNGKVVLNESESFYCGDAAGRPDGWKSGAKKDFSNSDLGFALTVEIRFETPETHFLGEESFVLSDDVISSLIPKAPTTGKRFEGGEITSKEFEVVISTGYPASGKSTFAKKYFQPAGYVIVNQDTLKTKDKCKQAVEAALKQGKSVIVDNTNGTIEIRSEYINIAKKYNASTRSLNFTTSRVIADHLNYYRERTQAVKHIPSMVYNIYNKHFVEPSINEGFKSVTNINFILELEEKDKIQYYIPNPKAKPQ